MLPTTSLISPLYIIWTSFLFWIWGKQHKHSNYDISILIILWMLKLYMLVSSLRLFYSNLALGHGHSVVPNPRHVLKHTFSSMAWAVYFMLCFFRDHWLAAGAKSDRGQNTDGRNHNCFCILIMEMKTVGHRNQEKTRFPAEKWCPPEKRRHDRKKKKKLKMKDKQHENKNPYPLQPRVETFLFKISD